MRLVPRVKSSVYGIQPFTFPSFQVVQPCLLFDPLPSQKCRANSSHHCHPAICPEARSKLVCCSDLCVVCTVIHVVCVGGGEWMQIASLFPAIISLSLVIMWCRICDRMFRAHHPDDTPHLESVFLLSKAQLNVLHVLWCVCVRFNCDCSRAALFCLHIWAGEPLLPNPHGTALLLTFFSFFFGFFRRLGFCSVLCSPSGPLYGS